MQGLRDAACYRQTRLVFVCRPSIAVSFKFVSCAHARSGEGPIAGLLTWPLPLLLTPHSSILAPARFSQAGRNLQIPTKLCEVSNQLRAQIFIKVLDGSGVTMSRSALMAPSTTGEAINPSSAALRLRATPTSSRCTFDQTQTRQSPR